MRFVPAGDFERALRSLDRDALAAFVADLWAAGGWETSVDGAVVVAERAERRRRIRVVATGRGLDRLRRRAPGLGGPDLGHPDVVVDASGAGRVAAAARAADAKYVPPGALENRLLYGVPRAAGAALSERHLDRPLAEVRGSGAGHPLAGPRPLLLGAIVVLAFVALAAAAGPLGLPPGGPVPPTAVPDGGQSAADRLSPAATAGVAAAGGPASTSTPTATEPTFPPGLSTAGVENVSKLADAHVAATKHRRYALDVSFDGPPAATGFEDFTSVRWSVRVESRRHFLVDATYRRSDEGEQTWRSRGIYSDGVTSFRRKASPDRTRYVAVPAGASDARAYLYVATDMIERYLDTGASVVRRTEAPDGPRFHVVATGTPERLNDSVVGYQAEALVTPDGRVTMLAVRYATPVDGEERTVRVRLDYSDFGTALVDPPDWHDEAKNETVG